MAKKIKIDSEIISKRLKISQAQQTILVAASLASAMVGVAIVLGVYFVKYITFNTRVITEKGQAIVDYSSAIADSGTCKKPKNGKTYSMDELKKCNPSEIDVGEVDGTLRYNVLSVMAKNEDLESVARNSLSVCKNPATGNKYTYDELLEKYESADSGSDRSYYLNAIKICSALRVIPDALPMKENDEALLASLNQIFLLSDWMPESLSPSSTKTGIETDGLGVIPVSLRIEADNEKTLTVLSNIEKSIREFSIESAKIEWASGDQLNVNAKANAFYTGEVGVSEINKTIRASEGAKKGN